MIRSLSRHTKRLRARPADLRPGDGAGGSVVRLANNNTVFGMRISGTNAAGTVFGNGVSNALPITDVNLTDNTFTNYSVGANLQDVSGRVMWMTTHSPGLWEHLIQACC